MILERILVLAYTPADCNQITDWAPFGGDTLAEIVNQHNKKLKKDWENNGYSPSDIDRNIGRDQRIERSVIFAEQAGFELLDKAFTGNLFLELIVFFAFKKP